MIYTIDINTRFSLLLLEFGEVYFEDFTVVFYPLVTPEGIEEKYVHCVNDK